MKKIKQMHKKFLSVILAFVLIFSAIPISGISLSVVAATNGKTVSQALDYMQGFVGTTVGDGQCPALAKAYYAYLGYSVSGNGKDYYYNVPSGWTRIEYTAGVVAQPGDVAVWKATTTTLGAKYGHVAVVASGDSSRMTIYEQGAGFGYKVKKNTITYGQYGQLTCLIRPDFAQDTTKPTDLKISANYTSVGIGDTVTFTYSISGASNRSIGIDKDGSRYKTIGVSTDNGSVSYVFTEPGTYCCIIEGSNSVGYDCSHGVWITVINTAPKDCSISANYTSIGIGDSVTFNYSISGATAQCIGIDKDGKRYANVTANSDKGTSTYTFKEKGIYCCIIEGYNNVGYNCSHGVWLTVIDTAPKECYISANKTNIALGETVTFDYKIVGATVQGIGIDKDGTRYANVTAKNDEGKSTYTFNEKGTYCCIIEGYNNVGYNCSHGVFITVGETPVIDNYRIKAINDSTIIDDETKTIYGLEEGVYDLEGFVEYSGCELKYNPTAFGFGTGTTVDIVKDGEVVDTYTIVIFGDINGDGYVDAFDVPDVMSFVNYDSQYESGSAQEMAADIDGDGIVDESDLFLIDLASTFAYTIEQTR